jgi:hypothetical protein
LCTIENKDLIILVFASFPSSKASQNSPNPKSAGVLYTEPTGGLLTLGRIFSPPNNSKISPYQNV